MASLIVRPANAVQTGGVAEKKGEDCMICQDKIKEGNIEIRKCGHKFCRDCDTQWRKLSSIQHTTQYVRNDEGQVVVRKTFKITSTCPACRSQEDLMSRSKESLAEELSHALGMLYRRNIFKLTDITIPARPRQPAVRPAVPAVQPGPAAVPRYIPPQIVAEMDDLTRQLIDQLNMEDQAMLAAPAPVAAPVLVTPPQVPRYRTVPELVRDHAYGLLRNPVRPRGRPQGPRTDLCANSTTGCVTVKTKLHCNRCNIVLCRSCKAMSQCPTCDRGVRP